MAAMEPLECRFRLTRALGEGILILLSELLPVGVLASQLDPSDLPAVVAGVGPATVLAFAIFGWGRWRSRFVVDDRGAEFRRSKGRLVTRLDWDEVEEIFLLGPSEFELRGAGKRVRLRPAYANVALARERCAPRLAGIRERLRARALREGRVGFRMPGGSWKPHLFYFAAVLVLTGITGLCLAPLLRGRFFSYPILVVFFGGSWLWGLRKRASVMGTRVILQREGIVVRRLDGRDRIAWEELDRPEWNGQDGLDLVLKSRRTISLPSALGNIAMLEEFLREGPPPVDSPSPGEAENRTMMQSP
jgi:hypothetical protein